VKKRKVEKERYISIFLILLWEILFTFSSLIALEPKKAITQYKLDTWQMERGLEQKSVISICQTRNGYIWLGTFNGLVRFDGIRFKTFKKENTKELQNNMIKALLEDRNGNLWIGTLGGGLSCLKDGKFTTYSLADYPNLKGIYTIFQDNVGTLWIGTENNGLTRLKNGVLTSYRTRDGLASDKVHAFYEDESGHLLIGTSFGISIYKPGETSIKFTAYTGKSGPFNKYIFSMHSTKNGELWIGCRDGLYRLENDTFTHFAEADKFPDPNIICLYEDRHQNLWVGTDGGGLIRIKNDRLETFPPGHILTSDFIYAIYEDWEKNLWIGTLEEGLHRLRDTLFTPYTTREGLNHNGVNCIYEDRKGSLWIGTRRGVNHLPGNGNLALKWTDKKEFLSNDIISIIEDNKGALWIGTYSGLKRYKDGKLENIDYHIIVRNNKIVKLEKDKRGAVWILTEKHLTRFYNGTFIESFCYEEGPDNLLKCFYFDQEDTLWLGTYGGGGLYRIKEGKHTRYTTNEGLVYNNVECFYKDKDGILYIGTRGGLSLLANGKFTNYTTRDGLLDDYIYSILEDNLEHLWLAGRTGLSRISKKELFAFKKGKIEKVRPKLFNDSDGMKNLFCNSCLKTQDGKLWFGTEKGLAIIDPSEIEKKTLPPPVVLEELIADGEAFYIGGIQPRYSENNPFVIQPGTRRLEFYYTGLSFVKSRQIKFKTKLEGYDDWREMGNTRNTSYTGLSPGRYTFKVKARKSDGEWSEKGASFSFYLKPYFWQTTWFLIICALAVISIGFIGYRLRVRQLKTRQKELTALVESRTREVENKNRQLEEQSEKLKEMDKIKSRFFANISHEFRTPLTLILGPLEQMIAACGEKEKETKRKLTLMLRNAQRLFRLINQLLELSKLESGKMKLQAVKTNIVSFLKGIADSFRFMAHQKELDLLFHAETEVEDIILYIDPRKMEDIMSNLLINAIKFTPPGGEITVNVKQTPPKRENNQKLLQGVQGDGFLEKSPPGRRRQSLFREGFVEISFSDTGPGIPAKQLDHIFDRFYQADSTYEFHEKGSGIGLALCKELVELHHGTIEARSREGEGSAFIIRLPIGDAHISPEERGVLDEPKASTTVEGDPALEIVMEEEENGSETEPGTMFNFESETGVDEKNIILVVEDSADMRDYIRGALEPVYTVVDAEDGQQGIQKAQEIIPDLIISDIMMPGVDGYELCRVLKTDVQTSHIPIILLTAKASEENILQGLETGADDYITKPFNTKILGARIKNLIDIRSQLQKNINREMTLRPVKTSVSKIDREFLQELQDVIKKNLSDPEFNVEELCKKLYMGNTTLYRKIQALCGQTPTEFIRSCRLKRAAQLLESGFGSVTEVAFEVGFSSRTYFTKCFKQRFQQLPSEYPE